MAVKYIAYDPLTGKKVKFGAKYYSDYTIHHDKERKQRFLTRFANLIQQLDERDVPENSSIFWSLNILWNKTTIAASFRDVKKRYPRLKYWQLIKQ